MARKITPNKALSMLFYAMLCCATNVEFAMITTIIILSSSPSFFFLTDLSPSAVTRDEINTFDDLTSTYLPTNPPSSLSQIPPRPPPPFLCHFTLTIQTLEELEINGGEDSFINIKYLVPTYQSVVVY